MSWLSLAYLKCAQSTISKKHWQHSALNQLFTVVTACLTAVLAAAAQHQESITLYPSPGKDPWASLLHHRKV